MNTCARLLPYAAALLLVDACASSGSGGAGRARGESPPMAAPAAGLADASYDWHGLMVAPFGTLLKDSPLPVHEVLLFHDETHRGDVDKDCYSVDGTPPHFVGRPPDEYLLCFDHDRLGRIDASVQLPADEASQVFARACALWSKGAAPGPGIGTTCEGREGAIAFSARLSVVPGEATARVSMTISGAAPNETVHDAVHDAPHEN